MLIHTSKTNRGHHDLAPTAWMVEDLRRDPVLAAKVILDIELPPHQQARLWAMWTSTFMMDSSGIGTGKTFNVAICAALRSILFEERVGCGLSKTFRQGQLIFGYFDGWARTCPLFRAQLSRNSKAEPALGHSPLGWIASFKNLSQFRVLAPNLLNDAQQMESESWNDGYFDEWVRWGNEMALNRTIMGRVRKPLHANWRSDSQIARNHRLLCSSAGYQWSPAYANVKRWQEQIAKGDKRYEMQSWDFRDVPPEWGHVLDMDMIEHMQLTLPDDICQMTLFGVWMKDSLGWYRASTVAAARDTSAAYPVLSVAA